jgi:hypothetical protein
MTLAQRREARETVLHSSKFEGEHPMVPFLYEKSLNGWEDDFVDFGGDGFVSYYSRIGRWILYHDDQGFVYGRRYGSVEAAANEITRLLDILERKEQKRKEQEEIESNADLFELGEQIRFRAQLP